MKKIKLIVSAIALMTLVGCDFSVKPDLVKNGHEFIIVDRCVKSHEESGYDYHYGYDFMSGSWRWHTGYHTETICDSTVQDTVEVNLTHKYYETHKASKDSVRANLK